MMRPVWSTIVPPVRNSTIRGPLASMHARRLPGPESASVVTLHTLPPRPPTDWAPNPLAVGNALAAGAARLVVIGARVPIAGDAASPAGRVRTRVEQRRAPARTS